MELEFPTTAAKLGKLFCASVIGDGSTPVHAVSALPQAGAGSISFCVSSKQSKTLTKINGAVVFIRPELVRAGLPLTFLVVESPRTAFSEVVKHFAYKPKRTGISPLAVIDPGAVLEEGVTVDAFSVIGEQAYIGKDTFIGSHCYIGAKVTVGEHCQLYPRVTLLEGAKLGNRVKIFSGTVIAADGFGLIQEQGLAEMPQIGSVVIEDDVRIGANCTVDRATLGETRIGKNSKLDDQVHIGHNVTIGNNCVICAQTGIAGSSILEDAVVCAGQVGIVDHITIGQGARLGAKTCAYYSLEGGHDYFLTPAIPSPESHRLMATWRKLPKLLQRLNKLEKIVLKEDLESTEV